MTRKIFTSFILKKSIRHYKHLLHPQFLHVLQPPSKTRGSPHSGQIQFKLSTLDSTGLMEVCSTVTGSNLTEIFGFSYKSRCISLYMSIRALPTAIGQQLPLEVSPLVARRAAYEGHTKQEFN